MKYILKEYNRNIPNKILLADLIKTAKKLGKQKISMPDYRKQGNYGLTTIRNRFNTWNEAVLKAGLKIRKPIPKEYLMNNLKYVWDTLKRQPSMSDMVKPQSEYSTATYIRKFGSWRRALKDFVKWQSRSRKHYRLLTKKSAVSQGIITKKKVQTYITKSMRFDIMKRDKFKCRLCGASPAVNPKVTLHIDHIIPRSKNGKNTPGKLQTLCKDCNYGKGTKLMQ